MWSVDRFRPSERGHRMFANAFLDLLRSGGIPLYGRVDPEPTNPPPTRLAGVRWQATRGVKWVLDRSTDLAPSLTRMAVTEWWSGVNGTARAIEGHVLQQVSGAIDELSEPSRRILEH